jgi:hypothetical protein
LAPVGYFLLVNLPDQGIDYYYKGEGRGIDDRKEEEEEEEHLQDYTSTQLEPL